MADGRPDRADPVRVAYVWNAPNLDWLNSGNNPYAGLLARALRRQGVALDPQPDVDMQFLWRLRRTHRIVHFNWIVRLYQHRNPFWAAARFMAFVGWLALARLLGYRIVFTLHNLLPHEQLHPVFDRLARYAIVRVAHAVICHCDTARDRLAARFGRRRGVYVIPHGSFRAAYPVGAGRAEARRALGLPEHVFVYGYFGNIRSYKGVERLVDVFRALPDADVRLLIAGEIHPYYRGPLGDPLDDPRVHTHFRFIANEEVQLILAAADVMVLPFHDALTSGSAILALGHGKPLVIPAVGCLTELASAAPCAVMYAAGDPSGLGRALRAARTLDLAAASAAARRVDADLGWDRIARATRRAYALPDLEPPRVAAGR